MKHFLKKSTSLKRIVREMSYWRDVEEMSYWRDVRSGSCPFWEVSVGELSNRGTPRMPHEGNQIWNLTYIQTVSI